MKNYIEQIQKKYEQAITILGELEKTVLLEHENASAIVYAKKQLIRVLQEIMQEPKVLAHERISSLLNVLCQEQLPEIIDYIVTLKEVPLPEIAPKGSFFAQKKLSYQQAQCIILLGNLAAAINENLPLWHQANSLLQNALLLYGELKTEALVKKPSDNCKPSCILF